MIAMRLSHTLVSPSVGDADEIEKCTSDMLMSGDVIDKSGESNRKFNMFGGVIESVIGGRAAARTPPAIREYMARSAPQRSSEMSYGWVPREFFSRPRISEDGPVQILAVA